MANCGADAIKYFRARTPSESAQKYPFFGLRNCSSHIAINKLVESRYSRLIFQPALQNSTTRHRCPLQLSRRAAKNVRIRGIREIVYYENRKRRQELSDFYLVSYVAQAPACVQIVWNHNG